MGLKNLGRKLHDLWFYKCEWKIIPKEFKNINIIIYLYPTTHYLNLFSFIFKPSIIIKMIRSLPE